MMEIKGKIARVLPPVTGTSAKGPWVRQEFIVDLPSRTEYHDSFLISAFGDEKVAMLKNLTIGQDVQVLVDLRVRESNGKFFQSTSFYRFVEGTETASVPTPTDDGLGTKDFPF